MAVAFSPESFFDLSEFEYPELFEEIVYVWDVLKLLENYISNYKIGTILSNLPKGTIMEDEAKIYIGKDCKIEPGAYIKGPCIIGDNCEIRNGAYIREHVILSSYCTIGHCTEIKQSLLLKQAKAPHFNYVGDSILGNRVNLGAGFICANVRHDRKEVVVPSLGKKISTGLKKFGAIFGDDCQMGCNGVSNPGTLFLKENTALACESLRGFHS